MIDTAFDVRTDAGTGDPDSTSKTLRAYHQLLWSKPLPNGRPLTLDASNPRRYLHHKSDLGEFHLTSDTVIPTWRSWGKMSHVIGQIPAKDLDSFQHSNHTIGGMMVFPGNRRPGTPTINGARGFNGRIADRFDLTLESIRRYYRGQPSPLSSTLSAYSDFFELFEDFAGYVDFFLLEDLVSPDFASVRVFTEFDDFSTPALPRSVAEYRAYRERAMNFINARNVRIAEWSRVHLGATTEPA